MNNSSIYLPPEYTFHKGTIAMVPFRNDIWREEARYAQDLIWEIVNIVSQHEKVFLCSNKPFIEFRMPVFNSNVELIEIPYDDIWARDISPFFIKKSNTLHGINFGFNAWGGIEEGSYYPWNNDETFSKNFCKYLGICSTNIKLILEGGAIANNGKGVIVATESVLLNSNRNPCVTKKDFENVLQKYLGIKKIIWLKKGFCFDETNGHVDVFLNFIDEHNLFLAWTEDKSHPQYIILNEIYDKLKSEYALDGLPFIIHKLPMPNPLIITEVEAKGICKNKFALERTKGLALYPTYNNAYIFNGGVLVPTFNSPEDSYAISLYKKMFKNRKIYPIYSKEFLIGGGNLHCILHEVPEV